MKIGTYLVITLATQTNNIMDKNEIQDKIQLKKHEISLENDSNRLSKLNKDLNILKLRYQIEVYKERIENISK